MGGGRGDTAIYTPKSHNLNIWAVPDLWLSFIIFIFASNDSCLKCFEQTAFMYL